MFLSHNSIDRLTNVITGLCGINTKGSKKEVDEVFRKNGFIQLVNTYEDCFKGHLEISQNRQITNPDYKLYYYTRLNLEELNGRKELGHLVDYYIKTFDESEKEYIEELFAYLNAEFINDNYEIVKIEESDSHKIYSLEGCMINYEYLDTETKLANLVLIAEHCDKCINKIKNKDYTGALTNARSMLEQVLREVQVEIKKIDNPNTRIGGYNGAIVPLLKEVLGKFELTLGLINPPKKGYEELAEGFEKLTNGISLIRHGMSDAHNISYVPKKKDALLAVNTSKTLSNFIVENYFEKFVKDSNFYWEFRNQIGLLIVMYLFLKEIMK
jgi:hypothetical protein